METVTITNFKKVGERFTFLGNEMIVMFIQEEKVPDEFEAEAGCAKIEAYLTASYKNKNDEICNMTFYAYHIDALVAENQDTIALYSNYYSEEALSDFSRDMLEAIDSRFNSQIKKIPTNTEGDLTGGFVVKLYWVPD